MQMWELAKGSARNLDEIFAPLKGTYIKRFEIRDPYCATLPSVSKLKGFLVYIQSSADTIDFLSIRCRENKDRDGDVEFYLDTAAGVVQVRSASRIGYADLGVNPRRLEGLRRAWDAAATPSTP